jgi:deazaflavin-dependent oxidoreductase (nitroreductase family)
MHKEVCWGRRVLICTAVERRPAGASRELLRRGGGRGNASSMKSAALQSVANEQVLYLATTGRLSGFATRDWNLVRSAPRVLLLAAETGENAGWVKNIRRNSKVGARIGELQINATARVLGRQADRELWDEVVAIADRKYGWGGGLPVESHAGFADPSRNY